MGFRMTGLPADTFRHLFGLSDRDLALHGALRVTAGAKPGFPDRIGLRDAEPGETLILLNHEHQPGDSPYRSRHAIFVAEGAVETFDRQNVIPDALACRPISLRAFDAAHMMVDADLLEGPGLAAAIESLLANPQVDYIHAHYAKRGCYAARIERA